MTVQDQDKFMLRLPDGMRAQIKADALANDRSMNAEIIARLSGTQANLRDQIAMAALTGLLASTANPNSIGPQTYDSYDWARISYRLADAMLEARDK